MADLLEEELHLIAKCSAIIPGRPHCSTPRRWADMGVKVPGGRREFLENLDIGGRRYTSREALARFFSRLSAARSADAAGTTADIQKPSKKTDRASERAAAIFGH